MSEQPSFSTAKVARCIRLVMSAVPRYPHTQASPCIVRDGTCVNALFTVFDGHGGASVATQAASLLHTRIIEASHGKAPGELGEAIKLAFQETDAQCCGDSPHNEVGAVCCSAVFAGRQLWIGAWRCVDRCPPVSTMLPG